MIPAGEVGHGRVLCVWWGGLRQAWFCAIGLGVVGFFPAGKVRLGVVWCGVLRLGGAWRDDFRQAR